MAVDKVFSLKMSGGLNPETVFLTSRLNKRIVADESLALQKPNKNMAIFMPRFFVTE